MSAEIIEKPAWRNREGIYADRAEAGKILSSHVKPYAGKDALVLAVPSGGVPVGLEIAKRLGIPFDLVIIRKIPIPGNTEAGFGAVSIEGDMILDDRLVSELGLTKQKIEILAGEVKKDLAARNRIFRSDRPFPAIAGKTLILVDDGLASGFTMTAAARLARRRNPARIIVAVPTAPLRTIEKIAQLADIIICPNIRESLYFAVASAYREWHDLSRSEVLALLKGAPWAADPQR